MKLPVFFGHPVIPMRRIYGKKYCQKFSNLTNPIRIVITPCGGESQSRPWLIQVLESMEILYAIPNNKKTWVWINNQDFDTLEKKTKEQMPAYHPNIIEKNNPNY